MLKLKNVSTFYGGIQALFELSLHVEEGGIVSIIGSNGAGKSTAINTISGINRCSSGTIEFLGERIDKLPTHKIVEMGLIQIPEGRHLFPRMTVSENLELGSFSRAARNQKYKNLDFVFNLFPKIKERRLQLAGTLSGGEQQMVAIARGLMAMPKLLILDEPSLGLAPIIVEHVLNVVKEINSQGITIFLIEQNAFKTMAMSDKVYVLENGMVVMSGKGTELLNNPKVKEAYLGL